MKTVKVEYGGFSAEQLVEENLYNAIYQQGREDKEKQIRDKMVRTSYGLGAYLTISEEDWEQIKEHRDV